MDGKPAKVYPENNSFIIEFTMPDHDTEVHVEKDSSIMVMPAKKEQEKKKEIKTDDDSPKVICPDCKALVPDIKYCMECGFKL